MYNRAYFILFTKINLEGIKTTKYYFINLI